MNKRRKIGRFWLSVGIIMLIEALTVTLWYQHKNSTPPCEVSELFTHYAGREDMNVVFFKDFQLNDSVTADVTMMEALDSASWDMLVYDFGLEKHIPGCYSDPVIQSTAFKFAPRGNYRSKMDPNTDKFDNDFVLLMYNWRIVMVFTIETEQQYLAIIDYIFKTTKTNEKL